MALNKYETLAGTQVRVKRLSLETAGIATMGGSSELSGLRLWESPGRKVAALALVGDTLTVVTKPRKTFGINLCRVKDAAGVEGEVYWTELRGNCEAV